MNTAIFSVVDAVLLEPLPYPDPERLVLVEGRVSVDGRARPVRLAGAAFTELRDHVGALESAAAYTRIRQNLTGGDAPLMVQVGWSSANLFEMLGIGASLGRTFRPGDPPGTLVLDNGLWLRHFGGDPEVLGRTLRLDGHAYTVVGVLPPGFELHVPGSRGRADVWKVPDDWWQNGDVWTQEALSFGILQVVGYRAPGASMARLRGELAAAGARHRQSSAELEKVAFGLAAQPLHEALVGEARPTLLLLLGAVGCVLLIACANVMNLLLVRAQARRREIAVRRALGCSRFGVVRLLLAESLLLAGMGGAAGIGLGLAGTRLLAGLQPPGLPRAGAVEVDASVLGFACLAALVSVLVFGLAPAPGASRPDLRAGVGDGRSSGSPAARTASRALVAAQLALSLVLLIGTGLLTASLSRLGEVEPGFAVADRLAFAVSLPGTRYERPLGTDRFFRELEDRIEALPGVRAAGVVWPQPLKGPRWEAGYAAGEVREEDNAAAAYYLATPGYFEAAGVPVLEGRPYHAGDERAVVMVSRALANRAWPGRDAVGQTVEASPWGGDPETYRVVGVAGDVRSHSLREAGGEALWFDSRGWSWTDWEVDYVVHAAVPPGSLVEPIREVLLSLDPEVPLADARPLAEDLEGHLATSRFALLLIGLFAVVAAVLAVIGLYGVVSYAVGRRAREIGIRVALGAGRRRILALVLGQGVRLAAAGLALGLLGAWGLTRLLESLLFGIGAHDPATFAAVALGLGAVAVAACLPAALRALRLDPSESLRAE
jgi:predicted permease